MLKGQCLCGAVKYHYMAALTEVVLCHCGQCQRAQGTPFASNAPIQLDKFTLVQGESLLRSYYASENKRRVFCSQCGSPLFSQRTDAPEVIRLRLGTVTDGVIPPPSYQIYTADKAAWFELDPQLTSYTHNKN